ncbi:MAG: amidohydrolase family protein, partial [Firmicutes bacterium]|nr:amidohydrolase family protein [Bacillota bacterium]
MIKAIINARIYDFKDYIENGFVLFDNQIIATGAMKDFKNEGFKIIDGTGQIVMPSLVCGHAHIYSTFARGLALPFNPKNFQEILDQLWWKIDRQIDNETTYYSGIIASVEFMKNGVTTIIDHHASGKEITGSLESLKKAVCDQAHLRGIFA